ncbi:MAG: bifunctional 4-hydroxy-2-oxoglutarate aldolase/2-dehydro-3-deoxy-phosphogluconate aldolase [Opitutales bacterium]|nr:bifunctional 4-hydroxy-2-oxoglutarate aldolase/2-dehydro-3-deoxy-phosphogluconate aldolase [Opitutales bacterium]
MADIRKIIEEKKIIAVLTIDDAKDAVNVANALKAGGVTAIELTLRTPAALESIRRIRGEVEGMTIAAGTVLKPEQIDGVVKAGADFAVSPGINPRVVKAAQDAGLFFGPGIMTPSEIEMALEFGCTLLKFFPAGTTGGLKHLNAMAAPYKHLGVKFIPLGGITCANVKEILSDKLIAAVGGSWLAKPDVINSGNFAEIERLAREAMAAIKA